VSCIRSAHKWSLNLTDEVKREIAIMKRLRHPNVVSLFEVIDDPTAKQVFLIQVGTCTAQSVLEFVDISFFSMRHAYMLLM
jgi:serine/threonine protein kinase